MLDENHRISARTAFKFNAYRINSPGWVSWQQKPRNLADDELTHTLKGLG